MKIEVEARGLSVGERFSFADPISPKFIGTWVLTWVEPTCGFAMQERRVTKVEYCSKVLVNREGD